MSPELKAVLDQLTADAKNGKVPYANAQEALISMDRDFTDYALFYGTMHEESLSPWPAKGLHQGDVLIGFQAETDSEFQLVVTANDYYERENNVYYLFPFTMKAGEFHLAWRNLSVFPSVKVCWSSVTIQNIKGTVRPVFAILSQSKSKSRPICLRTMLAGPTFVLDNHWEAHTGMVLLRKKENSSPDTLQVSSLSNA